MDYAPRGIVETLVDRAVALRIPNMNKRKLIKEMTDKDISKKIAYSEMLDSDEPEKLATPHRRRVNKTTSAGTSRRAG